MEWYIYLIIGASLILLGVVLLLITNLTKKKKNKVVIDSKFIDDLVLLLGDINNVKNVDVVNGRVKVEVNDLELVKLNEIKELAASGFFVTGNVIKILFKYDSESVKKSIEAKMGR